MEVVEERVGCSLSGLFISCALICLAILIVIPLAIFVGINSLFPVILAVVLVLGLAILYLVKFQKRRVIEHRDNSDPSIKNGIQPINNEKQKVILREVRNKLGTHRTSWYEWVPLSTECQSLKAVENGFVKDTVKS